MKRAEIEQLLPVVFQRTLRPGGPLDALLDVMEALHAPSAAILARLHTFFDPYQTPDAFVPFLARWVDLDPLLSRPPEETLRQPGPPWPSGTGRLRESIAAAAYLSKWRGTARGLRRFLTITTGIEGWEIDEQVPGPDGRPRPFHLRVRGPASAERYRTMVDRIVRWEKPAYATYELEFGS